jgi:hypothetical protein
LVHERGYYQSETGIPTVIISQNGGKYGLLPCQAVISGGSGLAGRLFLQNKANLPNSQASVTSFQITNYDDFVALRLGKKAKPICRMPNECKVLSHNTLWRFCRAGAAKKRTQFKANCETPQIPQTPQRGEEKRRHGVCWGGLKKNFSKKH